jgi:hypothetical protein
MHHCMFIFVFDVGVRIECLHAFDSIGCRVCAAQPSEKHNFVRVYIKDASVDATVCAIWDALAGRAPLINSLCGTQPATETHFPARRKEKIVSHHAVSLFCTLLAQKKRLL